MRRRRDAPMAGRRLTLILGALTAFGPLSVDMYLPALPTLAGSFGTSPNRVQLTLSAFFLGFGVGQLVYGPLSDRGDARRCWPASASTSARASSARSPRGWRR